MYEPLVEIEHRRSIEKTTTDCVQATLCENEMPDMCREACCHKSGENYDKTENGRRTSDGGPLFENVQGEGCNEIHAARREGSDHCDAIRVF